MTEACSQPGVAASGRPCTACCTDRLQWLLHKALPWKTSSNWIVLKPSQAKPSKFIIIISCCCSPNSERLKPTKVWRRAWASAMRREETASAAAAAAAASSLVPAAPSAAAPSVAAPSAAAPAPAMPLAPGVPLATAAAASAAVWRPRGVASGVCAAMAAASGSRCSTKMARRRLSCGCWSHR